MKTILTLALLLAVVAVRAQTQYNKSIKTDGAQSLEMDFDHPNLIKISTWDKNEVAIQGTVSINSGESDNAFEITSSVSGGVLSIRNIIQNLKSLPKRITITRDGQKITFKSEEDYDKYKSANGGGYNMKTVGLDIDIVLEIKVPANMTTKLRSVYGMVEIKDFTGPLSVESTYGGVDAVVVARATGELNAETNYGQIFTNLELKFSSNNVPEKDFHTFVSAKPGSGPRYFFESKYGNVYLRKPTAQ